MDAMVPETPVSVGYSICAKVAPAVFRMNDDGKFEVYEKVTDENKDEVREAIATCPVSPGKRYIFIRKGGDNKNTAKQKNIIIISIKI